MAEWGKYLKNAVANVEQQLDKVLLENQSQTQSPRASVSPGPSVRRPTRPDLQERLRRAATASKTSTPDSKGSTPQPENTQARDVPQDESANRSQDGNEAPSGAAAAVDAATETQSLASAPRTDAPAQATEDSAEPDSVPDIITTQELVVAPDLGLLLNQARKIALNHRADDTLEFVDALEAFKGQYDAYDSNVKDRVKSMNSKIAYLSHEQAARTEGSEQRVALLLEEGQRLSQQELKLGLIIKKLRAEKASALAKETTVQAKDKELAVLRAEKTAIMNQLKEQEALAEHFRGLAESASVGELALSAHTSSDAHASDTTSHSHAQTHLLRRLEAAESNHEVAKRTWHDLESSLLARIAELELNAEARAASAAQASKNLRELQDSARETRDQMIALQDELDASQERWHATEKQYLSEIERLQEHLRHKPVSEEEEKSQLAEQEDSALPTTPGGHEDNLGGAVLGSSARGDELEGEIEGAPQPTTIEIDPSEVPAFGEPADAPMEPFEEGSFRTGEDFLNGPNGPVGPSGPFGSLADDFDSGHRPSISRDNSRDNFEDSFSFMAPSASRRESSIVGSEAVSGSQLHIVKKLTLTVRRLENELSTVRKACELSEQQRDEAQTELVRHLDAQDNLAALQQKYADLEKVNSDLSAQVQQLQEAGVDKSERIQELEADVRDLKDMYREQIEALITEIEHVKGQGAK